MDYTKCGVSYPITLPHNYSLVLEGGGTRGYFTAGVLDAFLQENIIFPYVIAVSAGSSTALSYLSGQIGRNKVVAQKHMHCKEYFGLLNLLKHKSLVNTEYLYYEMVEKHVFYDFDVLRKSPIKFLVGALDCESGKSVWYPKEEFQYDWTPAIASCAMPFICPAIHYKDKTLLDGGIYDAIPIHKSIEDKNEFHIIILTQNKGYRKNRGYGKVADIYYKKYPNLVESLKTHHIRYNQQIEFCEKLEKEGKALIIRPEKPMIVGRIDRDPTKLTTLYNEGEEIGTKFAKKIKAML